MRLPDNFTLQNGKYRIIRFISAGGFGCTYEAEHVLLDKRVAIKEFFINEYCNRDANTHGVSVGTDSRRPLVEKLREKFIREAKSLNRMSHHGIVSVYDVFEENGTAYYVMDFIEGESISDMLKKHGPMPEAEALRYIRQVCEALRYVHSKGIMHLDIKPGNIMVDGEGNAILIDFGTSKQYDMVSGENTSTLLGLTPGYAPPEQMRHKVTSFTPATDIYALGATLYKMLTGITPPDPLAMTAGEELESLPASVTPTTRRAIAEAMQLNVNNRPQSVDEFMTLLKGDGKVADAKDDATVIDKPQSDKTIYGPVIQPPVECTMPVTQPTKKKGWLIPALVAAGVAVGVILAFLLMQKPSSPEDTADLVVVADTVTEMVETPAAAVAVAEPEPAQVETPEPIEEPKSEPKQDPAPAPKNDYAATGSYNGHDYVDLGLSVKWATCNVGASTPSGYGDYFAWGETTPKGEYSWSNYEYQKSNEALKSQGVINSSGNLTRQYDAATANWGGSWRMPTINEIGELNNRCTWEWTKLDGKIGYKVMGSNGNSLFLPAAEDRQYTNIINSGHLGYYWSSTANDACDRASSLYLDGNNHVFSRDIRYFGLTVRPVIE